MARSKTSKAPRGALFFYQAIDGSKIMQPRPVIRFNMFCLMKRRSKCKLYLFVIPLWTVGADLREVDSPVVVDVEQVVGRRRIFAPDRRRRQYAPIIINTKHKDIVINFHKNNHQIRKKKERRVDNMMIGCKKYCSNVLCFFDVPLTNQEPK